MGGMDYPPSKTNGKLMLSYTTHCPELGSKNCCGSKSRWQSMSHSQLLLGYPTGEIKKIDQGAQAGGRGSSWSQCRSGRGNRGQVEYPTSTAAVELPDTALQVIHHKHQGCHSHICQAGCLDIHCQDSFTNAPASSQEIQFTHSEDRKNRGKFNIQTELHCRSKKGSVPAKINGGTWNCVLPPCAPLHVPRRSREWKPCHEKCTFICQKCHPQVLHRWYSSHTWHNHN